MAGRLFAERFLVEPEGAAVPEAHYDDRRGYAVTDDGHPVVEIASAGQTHTVTEIRGEAPDSDPEPDTQTWTFVESEGADVAFAGATDTLTRVRAEVPDTPWAAGPDTFTKVRAEGRDQASLALEESVMSRLRLATMTKTGVERPSDNDSDA